MHYPAKILPVLALSTILGMAMIGSGLAGLTAPTKTKLQQYEEAKAQTAEPQQEEPQDDELQVIHEDVAPEVAEVDESKFLKMPADVHLNIKAPSSIIAVVKSYGEQVQEEAAKELAQQEKAKKLAADKEQKKKEEELAKKIPNHDTYIKADTTVYGSLYKTANSAGIPDNITQGLIKALSYDVDFQRDIKRGDKLTALYEGTANYKGNVVKGSKLHYVKLELGSRDVEIYVTANGYYYADGSSAKKSLLRTPVNAAHITSGFGMRFHPILGYSKMHKGTDFGASVGTPIYAAGNGVIEKMGPFGTYGNYVKIKHNKTYETAYAHCSRFAKGLAAGSKVKQGQVIAYVGTTGRSTGPHLHYELIKNGDQVNPTSATNLNFADKLGGKDLKKFKAEKADLASKLKSAPSTREQLAALVVQRSKEKQVALNQ